MLLPLDPGLVSSHCLLEIVSGFRTQDPFSSTTSTIAIIE
jgi:hypothetical protein